MTITGKQSDYVKELQAQLGHSNIQTTLQIYTAITDEQRIATPDKITSFINF